MANGDNASRREAAVYARPSVTADVLAFTTERGRLQTLLVKRQAPPFEGRWAIPGGFIAMDETAEAAAARVFSEKAGISGAYMEQLYTFSTIDRDPRMRIISVAYLALAPKSKLAAGGAHAALFTVERDGAGFRLFAESGEALPASELAFDHAGIIATAMARMAGKLDYTDIGFECLEDKRRFTLSELCDVYSAISGRQYDLPNFRRFIKKRYEETGRIAPTGERVRRRGTPAMVYSWKEDAAWNGY